MCVCVCVCARARACVRACVRACMHLRGCGRICVGVGVAVWLGAAGCNPAMHAIQQCMAHQPVSLSVAAHARE